MFKLKSVKLIIDFMFVAVIAWLSWRLGTQFYERQWLTRIDKIAGTISTAIPLIGLIVVWLIGKILRNDDRQVQAEKVINLAISQIERLEAKLAVQSPAATMSEVPAEVHNWPWGSHHTIILGHLDAAARRFWKLYDPSDPSTAPTNDMVADWLITERGVSNDKARAMASILRADGLPAGRRR